jgi:dipeptidyl aminopeptidase/acylaminoacyl peptidase
MTRRGWTFAAGALLCAATEARGQTRLLQPEDLFRVERIGAIAWTPARERAAIEIRRPGRWLDGSIPTSDIGVLDVASGALRVVSPSSRAYVGFFGASWSPNGKRLLFLSLDTNAVIRPWLWNVGTNAATALRGLRVRDGTADPAVVLWSDADHAVVLTSDSTRPNDGPMYVRIQRGRNAAQAWRRDRTGHEAAVTVVDSRGPDTATAAAQLVSVDVRTGAAVTLTRGAILRPRVSADGRTISYRIRDSAFAVAPASRFFGPDAQGEAAYELANAGGSAHHIDSRTGAPVSAPDTQRPPPPPAPPAVTLRTTNDAAFGTMLALVRANRPDTVVWRGNAWVRGIELGRTEAIRYTALDGSPLSGWVLYPPRYTPGRPIPVITFVYPGNIYGARPPTSFDIFNEHFEHPQMFAALGYGVVVPSMPEPERPLQMRALDALPGGVLPLLDTLIARGIADPTRIAVLGQSAGGYATMGLITLTTRFRTAIASAGYANLTSLYGTFYGQYRYGDGGNVLHAQVLRMLQFERGYYGAGGPPWEAPEQYRVNSPIERVANVRTPIMLIQGDLDFIPIQQSEELFTALYRRDQRAKLVRYTGEGHTIAARPNVLDLWRRMEDWLRETMPPRR